MAARDADFLGEGTVSQGTAAPLTQAQREAADAARRARILQASRAAQQPYRSAYNQIRSASDRRAQQLSNETVIADRIRRTGSAQGNQGNIFQNLAKDPVTSGVLLAPYGVLGAGAAAGGLAAGGTGSIAPGGLSAGQTGLIASPFGPGTLAAAGAGGAGAAAAPAAAAAGGGGLGALGYGLGAAGVASTVAGMYGNVTQPDLRYQEPAPVDQGTLDRVSASQQQGGAYTGQINDAVQRALNAANSYTQSPAVPAGSQQGYTQALAQLPAGQRAAATPQTTLPARPAQNAQTVQRAPNVPSIYNASNFQFDQMPAQQVNYQAQAQQAAARQAPQIVENGQGRAGQQSALSAAQSFRPDTSGIGAIQAARADTSGASGLLNFQGDMAGIQRLDAYQPTNANQGISNVENYQTDMAGIQRLDSYNPTNANSAIRNLENFNPSGAIQGATELNQFNAAQGLAQAGALNEFQANRSFESAQALQRFQAEGANEALTGLRSFNPNNPLIGQLSAFQADRTGVDNLETLARQAEGPSAAQALLASQSDRDIRSAIAIARSARGGPAAIAQAQRQAQSSGAATASETRGQAAALRAQEQEAFRNRQLLATGQAAQLRTQNRAQEMQALQAAGVLITDQNAQILQNKIAQGQILSAADAQKLSAYQAAAQQITAGEQMGLQAKVAAGQLISAAEAQKLQAKVAAGQLLSEADQMKLAGFQSAGQLRSTQDSQLLSAAQSAGQLRLGADQVRMSGLQSGLQARSTQDQQLLGAATAAGQLRAQNDATTVNARSAGANILLEGSRINQQGAIAAANAQLTASGQQLQSLALQGQISSDIRNADISVLQANLSANLQQLNLNDTQVRAFAQMDLDRQNASQNAQLQAAQLGLNAASVQSAIDLGWQQFAQSQLTNEQQRQLQISGLRQGVAIQNQQNQTQQNNQLIGLGRDLLLATGRATSDERAKKSLRPVSGREIAQALRDSPASSYEYREPSKPGRAPGRHVGPMAQGLQKSRLFAPAVSKTSDGTLAVDGTRLALGLHAAVGHLQKEIDVLKKHRKTRTEARA